MVGRQREISVRYSNALVKPKLRIPEGLEDTSFCFRNEFDFFFKKKGFLYHVSKYNIFYVFSVVVN